MGLRSACGLHCREKVFRRLGIQLAQVQQAVLRVGRQLLVVQGVLLHLEHSPGGRVVALQVL